MSLSRSQGKLHIVGIGPGGVEHITKRAEKALLESEYIIGNGTYLDQIATIIRNKKIIRSGMGGEAERARKAVSLSKDHIVSIISGVFANVYDTAGTKKKIEEKEGDILIEVIPGV